MEGTLPLAGLWHSQVSKPSNSQGAVRRDATCGFDILVWQASFVLLKRAPESGKSSGSQLILPICPQDTRPTPHISDLKRSPIETSGDPDGDDT